MNLNEKDEQNSNPYNELQEEKLMQAMKKFAEDQYYYYDLELKKEEEDILSLTENLDEAYLTSKGIFINNLILTEKGFTSYGKIEINLQNEGIPDKDIKLKPNSLLEQNFREKKNDLSAAPEYIINLDLFNVKLNPTQISAVQSSLAAPEISIIHGPPGTGKTSTIVEIILQLLRINKKVLVCAPSNVAVDTIAERFVHYVNTNEFKICRLGHPTRVLMEVQEICLENIIEQKYKFGHQMEYLAKEITKMQKDSNYYDSSKLLKMEEELKYLKSLRNEKAAEILDESGVIFSTIAMSSCEDLSNGLSLKNSFFDVVLIDEAAQAKTAEAFLAIKQGKKLILSGDHHQLYPVVKNRDAGEFLKKTIFDFCRKKFKKDKKLKNKIIKFLNTQYRMNESIMKFSAQYFYKNKLIAHETVKNHLLREITSLANITNIPIITDFNQIITTNPFIFIDTSNSGFYEEVDSNLKSKMNDLESIICMNLIHKLTSLKINPKDIGIITPYASQVNLLLKKINDAPLKDRTDIEVETVDGFQGREKEVIILSLVRSNQEGIIGFVQDKNRINVAITRAKRCVIVIINTKTFYDFDTYYRPKERFIFTFCNFLFDNAYNLPIEKIITKKDIEKLKEDINTRKIKSILTSSTYTNYNRQNSLINNYAFKENHNNIEIKNFLPNFHDIVKENFRKILLKNSNFNFNGYSAPHLNPIENRSYVNFNQQPEVKFIPSYCNNLNNKYPNPIKVNDKPKINPSALMYIPKSVLESNKQQSEKAYQQSANTKPNEETLSKTVINEKKNKNTLLGELLKNEKKTIDEATKNMTHSSKNQNNNNKLDKDQNFVIKSKSNSDSFTYKPRFIKEIKKNVINTDNNELLKQKSNNLTVYKNEIQILLENNSKINSHNKNKNKKHKKLEKNNKKYAKKNQLFLFLNNNPNICIPISDFKKKFFVHDLTKIEKYKKKNEEILNNLKRRQEEEIEKLLKDQKSYDDANFNKENEFYDDAENPNEVEKCMVKHDSLEILSQMSDCNSTTIRINDNNKPIINNQMENPNYNEENAIDDNGLEHSFYEENDINENNSESESRDYEDREIYDNGLEHSFYEENEINENNSESESRDYEDREIYDNGSEHSFYEENEINEKNSESESRDYEDSEIYDNESKEIDHENRVISQEESEESDCFANEKNKYFYFIIADNFFKKYVSYLKNKKANKEEFRVFDLYFSFNYFKKKYELLEEDSSSLKSLKSRLESINNEKNFLKLEHLNYNQENIIFVSDYIPNLRYMNKILNENVIAFDSEWTDEKIGTSIFQISTQDKFTYIFDLNVCYDSENSNSQKLEKLFRNFFYKLFLSETNIKIAWDFRHDIHCLKKKFPDIFNKTEWINSMIDLLDYKAKGIHNAEGINSMIYLMKNKVNPIHKGLSGYCHKNLGYPLDKTYQMSDWDKRPLSQEQLTYAAMDSIACLEIYERLKEHVKFDNKKWQIKN